MKIGNKVRLLYLTLKNRGVKVFFNTILNYFTFKLEPNRVLTQPIYIQIEPTTRCNLKCKMCYGTYKRRINLDMSFNNFKKILNQFPQVITIHLQGLGEPFLNKEVFKMIKYSKSKGVNVNLSTNATLLNKELNKQIINSGLDNIEFSIDGAKASTYNKIRTGSDFDKVIKNIKEFVKQKGNLKKPTLKITSVIMNDNSKEMLDLVKLSHDLNINSIYLLIAQEWNENQGLIKSNDLNIEMINSLKNAKNYAKELGVYFDTSIPMKLKNSRKCKRPWLSVSIIVDGYITPCCRVTNPNICNFGNIYKDPFKTIWNKGSYRDFRKKLKTEQQLICKNCELYYRDPFDREDL